MRRCRSIDPHTRNDVNRGKWVCSGGGTGPLVWLPLGNPSVRRRGCGRRTLLCLLCIGKAYAAPSSNRCWHSQRELLSYFCLSHCARLLGHSTQTRVDPRLQLGSFSRVCVAATAAVLLTLRRFRKRPFLAVPAFSSHPSSSRSRVRITTAPPTLLPPRCCPQRQRMQPSTRRARQQMLPPPAQQLQHSSPAAS